MMNAVLRLDDDYAQDLTRMEELSPERLLLGAMLNDAILELRTLTSKAQLNRIDRGALVRLQRWFESDSVHCDPEGGISFLFTCMHLGLDAGSIRKAVQTSRINTRILTRGRKRLAHAERLRLVRSVDHGYASRPVK